MSENIFYQFVTSRYFVLWSSVQRVLGLSVFSFAMVCRETILHAHAHTHARAHTHTHTHHTYIYIAMSRRLARRALEKRVTILLRQWRTSQQQRVRTQLVVLCMCLV